MELTVGITEMRPGWSIVLDQIGVSYQEIDSTYPIDPEKIAIVILSAVPTGVQRENLFQFLKSGGGILTGADCAPAMLNCQLKEVFIKYLYPDQDSIFSYIPLCDLEMKCEIAANAQHLPNQNGVKTVAIQDYQNGKIVILPSAFCERLIESKGIRRKSFPSPAQTFPSERVSQVSGGSIRHIIQRSLEYLFHGRKMPFLQTWFFPNGEKNIFAFRVDTDSASKAQVQEQYRICRQHDISATWFVDTKSHEKWINYFSELENQEIGYHCYDHRVYSDFQANRLDMEKGLSILKKVDIEPTGYAAPFGELNPQLGQLIQEVGFDYSSEFGCAYDDLPFFPYMGAHFAKTLQVPIHPVSTRRLQLAKHNGTQMVDYYLGIIQQKLFLNDPIIFYDHPIHGHFRIFEHVFSEIKRKNIPNMTLQQYQSWWRKRLDARWRATYEKEKLSIHASTGDASIRLRVIYPDKREFLMPLDKPQKQIRLENEVLPSHLFDLDQRKLRRRNLKMLWHDIESHYGKLR